jgi:membrane protein implicated in regulation of membrane protease activity
LSPAGALLLVLIALILLGCLAAWLLNVPLWAIAAFAAIGSLVTYRVYRRLTARRARQNTEA